MPHKVYEIECAYETNLLVSNFQTIGIRDSLKKQPNVLVGILKWILEIEHRIKCLEFQVKISFIFHFTFETTQSSKILKFLCKFNSIVDKWVLQMEFVSASVALAPHSVCKRVWFVRSITLIDLITSKVYILIWELFIAINRRTENRKLCINNWIASKNKDKLIHNQIAQAVNA